MIISLLNELIFNSKFSDSESVIELAEAHLSSAAGPFQMRVAR